MGVQVAGELAWRARGTVGDEISEVSRARECRALQDRARTLFLLSEKIKL